MEMLHHKLNKIEKQCAEKASTLLSSEAVINNNNQKNTRQSVQGSKSYRIADWRKNIRTIESRYIEVFLEGSFKHYKRIMDLNGFSYNLETVNIHEWANRCLNQCQEDSSGCCC
jgi:hypothetical protein